jgi:glycine cleavage system T protein
MPEPVLPERVRVVIVGAGIVGCSTAYHLAELGWTDVVVLDQGPLFETGGSTSHAPGIVFQVNPSRTVSKLAQETVALFGALSDEDGPVWQSTDSLEIATTPARLEEAKRRQAYGLAWDLDARLLDPGEAQATIPLLNTDRVLGALWVRGDGVVRPWAAARALARLAEPKGARFVGNTAVTGFRISGGRVRGVETANGIIAADVVVIASGIWGPVVGALAGITVPLMPFQHLYAETEPLPERAGIRDGAVTEPVLRHQDASMYFKAWGERYGIGSYRHEPLPIEARDLPFEGDHEVAHMPDFPEEHFAFALRETRSVLPAVGSQPIWRRLNGIFSFTPDANSLIGESPDVRGLWLAEAVWVTHGGGAGKLVAEWIAEGIPSHDPREVDIRRFHHHAFGRWYIRRRGIQQYREVYDVIHPNDQFTEPRNLRLTPFHAREQALGAVFFEGAGWERPRWYEANAPLLEGREWPLRGQWEARNWSPIAGAEHRAIREAAGMMDLTPFVKLRIAGPGALAFVQRLASADLDRSPGRVTYTLLLNERGGIAADLTITRLADDEFLLVDGAGTGLRTIKRVRELAQAAGEVTVEDVSSSMCCIGMWGPYAQAIVDSIADDPVTFGRFRAAQIRLAGIPCLMLRVSYVGEHGWEIYAHTEYGVRLWDVLAEAGRPFGIAPAGTAAQDSLRLEKGYRLWGQDIHTEFDPFEAGLEFTVAFDKGDFIGRDALLRKRDAGPTQRLSCLVLDDDETVPMGREPILGPGGSRAEKVGYVTSASAGFTVGRTIAYGYLPVALARPGERVEILYFGRRLGATVSEEPLYDPAGERLKAPMRETVGAA